MSAACPPLRLVLLGSGEFAVPTLTRLARGSDLLLAVVTRPDRPAGRGRHLRSTPVKLAAAALRVRVLQPERVSSPGGLALLRPLAPDLLVVAAFREILSSQVLGLPRLGAINLHPSLLPRFRGGAPIARALLAGETETGVSVIWMAESADSGDLVLQEPEPIFAEDDAGLLEARLAAKGALLVARALDLIRRGSAPRLPQDSSRASPARYLEKHELEIDWTRPTLEIVNLVRAASPRPGARTWLRGQPLKVLRASVWRDLPAPRGSPGEVAEVGESGIEVWAGEGGVVIEVVQPVARKVMAGPDFARGSRLSPGEAFLSGGKLSPKASLSGSRGERESDTTGTTPMEPEDLEACCEEGMTLKNEGRYEEALCRFEAVLAAEPGHARAHLGLGLVYCFTGEFERSVEELKTAVSCRPDWVEARLNLAKTLAMVGNYQEARAEFEQVLVLQPDHAEAKKHLAYFDKNDL